MWRTTVRTTCTLTGHAMLELLGASVVNRQTVGGVLRVMYRSTWPLCLLIVVVFVCQTMAADGE